MTNNSTIFSAYAAALLIFLGGCGKHGVAPGPSSDNLVIRVSPEVTAMTRGYHEEVGTINDFDLWIHNRSNSRYSYPNTRFTLNGTEWTPESMMLWESKSAVVDFLAVSPSLPTRNLSLDTSKDNSIFEFEVESVQTEDSRKSDLLTYSGYGYSLSGDSNGEKKIPVDDAGKMIINFSHALTLFQVELTFGTEFNHNGVPKECPISKLTVSGTVLEGEYVWVRESDTFEVKKKSGVAPSAITAYRKLWTPAESTTGRCQSVYECIFIPQEVVNMKIDFMLNGKPYTYTHNGRITPSGGGQSMVLPLIVGKDEILLGGEITAKPWVAGNGENGEDIETD